MTVDDTTATIQLVLRPKVVIEFLGTDVVVDKDLRYKLEYSVSEDTGQTIVTVTVE